jgi:hypothetical protein
VSATCVRHDPDEFGAVPSYPVSLRPTLRLTFYLRCGLFAFMRATCPAHLIFRDLIAVPLVLGEKYSYRAIVYVFFCRFLLLASCGGSLLLLLFIAVCRTAEHNRGLRLVECSLILNKISYISYINGRCLTGGTFFMEQSHTSECEILKKLCPLPL